MKNPSTEHYHLRRRFIYFLCEISRFCPDLIFDDIHILDIQQTILSSINSPGCLLDDICQIFQNVYSKPCFHKEITVVIHSLLIFIDLNLEMNLSSDNVTIPFLCHLILDLSEQEFNIELIIPHLCEYYKTNRSEIFRNLLSDILIDTVDCENYLFDIICSLKGFTREHLIAISQSKKVKDEISLLKKNHVEIQIAGAEIFPRENLNHLITPSDDEDSFYWE